MKTGSVERKCPAMKLAAALLCVLMLSGWIRPPAFAAGAENPAGPVGIYCSRTAKDALGDEQLQALVDLIVTSVDPQAVNLLIERFPCFTEAAAKNDLGREIGLYIYFDFSVHWSGLSAARFSASPGPVSHGRPLPYGFPCRRRRPRCPVLFRPGSGSAPSSCRARGRFRRLRPASAPFRRRRSAGGS